MRKLIKVALLSSLLIGSQAFAGKPGRPEEARAAKEARKALDELVEKGTTQSMGAAATALKLNGKSGEETLKAIAAFESQSGSKLPEKLLSSSLISGLKASMEAEAISLEGSKNAYEAIFGDLAAAKKSLEKSPSEEKKELLDLSNELILDVLSKYEQKGYETNADAVQGELARVARLISKYTLEVIEGNDSAALSGLKDYVAKLKNVIGEGKIENAMEIAAKRLIDEKYAGYSEADKAEMAKKLFEQIKEKCV
ncbi:MAG: hypothetical protein KDD50_13635 [Bdellovibrionales bacterium]|nr:hypothetical protein [Bdellovibrionales bacterium]